MDNSRGQIFDNLSDMLCGLGFQNRSSPQPIPSSSDTNQDSTLQGNDCYVVLNEGVNTFASNEQQPLLYQDRRSPPLPPKAKSQKKNLPMSPSSGSTRWYDDRPQEARVPDPFPELGMLSGSYTDLDKRPFLMRIYNEDGSVRTVTVEKDYLAREVCYLMVLKNHSIDDKNWVLVEQLTDLKLERCLEDHEIVLQIYQTWDENSNNRFIFRKNFLKYQLFENPSNFFPSHMIDSKEECETPLTEDAEQAKKILLERLFTNTERIPEMHGFLHCKDGNKRSWKKLFFMLRASGLYYSTKGSSKESKHLHCFSQFTGVHAYTAVNGRKHFGAPNDNVFCLKPVHSSDLREIKCLCAEDDGTRQSWITGIRLAKYKSQLRNNYLTSLRRQAKLQDLNAADYSPRLMKASCKDRVAMDFTQTQSRIVDNPCEAFAVAIAEGHEWRKRAGGGSTPRTMGSPRLSSSPRITSPIQHKGIESGIHITQPWFHSRVSREESELLLTQQGAVDGLFLLRESQSLSGVFVLTLCFGGKIRHYQIGQCENQDGQIFYSLDEGITKFMDLVQLVEFYELNAVGLPSKLLHACTLSK